jgi:hypothetical protein
MEVTGSPESGKDRKIKSEGELYGDRTKSRSVSRLQFLG